jgi:hypothetical protein
LWQIIGAVGKGSYGTVYKAKAKLTGEMVNSAARFFT